ncbi:MAG: hypothetical protein CSA66_04695 [Proteobacteria bacterium]|nr:MAG: hypothetical protein CSA66_04695 [Pseudomonadota bacterium]
MTASASPSPLATVGVFGAGVVGQLAALALAEARPDLEVTLVGDAPAAPTGAWVTTPDALPLLHRTLGLDVHRFVAAVAPGVNLGTRFVVGGVVRHAAFAPADLATALAHDGGSDRASLAAQLLAAGRAPTTALGGREYPLLTATPFGWVMDEARLAAALGARLTTVGVTRRGGDVAEVLAAGGRVEAVITDAGERLSFDLYVDSAGGEASLLGAVGVGWRGAEATAATVRARTDAAGDVLAGVFATRLERGWCHAVTVNGARWLAYDIGAGEGTDQAVAELRRAFGDLGEVWFDEGRRGRREALACGNAFGVGGGYGWAPPLTGARLEAATAHLLRLVARVSRTEVDVDAPAAGYGALDPEGVQAAEERARAVAPSVTAAQWAQLVAMRERVVAGALTPRALLERASADRGLLDDLIWSDDSWVAPLAARLRAAAPTAGRSRDALTRWAAGAGVQVRWPTEYARTPPAPLGSPVLDFGKFIQRIPDAVLQPANQDQLAACLRALSARRIPFKVRGNGHSSGGQVLIEDGVVVDLRRLRRIVRDDPAAQEITVEAGCFFEEIANVLVSQGRWLPNLLMDWRTTVGGSLVVGGFGDTTHLEGTLLRMVRGLTVMTLDGERHEVGPGDALFDYTLGGRGQLAVITEATLATVTRPRTVYARIMRWEDADAFIRDALIVSQDRRYAIFRGRIFWDSGMVMGGVGNFVDSPAGEDAHLEGLAGKGWHRVDKVDYYVQNLRPPDAHWLPAVPAVEVQLPYDPADHAAGVALVAEMRAQVVATGLAKRTPLGNSIMLLPNADHPPLAPLPDAPMTLMLALRPEMPPKAVPEYLEAIKGVARWAMERGGRLYLMCVQPEMGDFLERQFGSALPRFRALKARYDPLGILNPGLF